MTYPKLWDRNQLEPITSSGSSGRDKRAPPILRFLGQAPARPLPSRVPRCLWLGKGKADEGIFNKVGSLLYIMAVSKNVRSHFDAFEKQTQVKYFTSKGGGRIFSNTLKHIIEWPTSFFWPCLLKSCNEKLTRYPPRLGVILFKEKGTGTLGGHIAKLRLMGTSICLSKTKNGKIQ